MPTKYNFWSNLISEYIQNNIINVKSKLFKKNICIFYK